MRDFAALFGMLPSGSPTPVAEMTPEPQASNTPAPTPTPVLTATPIPADMLLEVGDSYFFGRYEQESEVRDGPEDIEWIVLAKGEEGALLLSKYVLDCIPYNETRTSITWADCTLRQWMNGFFYMEAFTDEEQQGVMMVTLDNEANPVYGTRGCGPTEDKIFALSVTEARKYLTDANRNTCGTTYARAQGAKFRTDNALKQVYWWLRTPGDKATYAMITSVSENSLDYVGNPVGATFEGGRANNTGVRPSLWLSWSYIGEHAIFSGQ